MTKTILVFSTALLLTAAGCNRESAPPANDAAAAMNEAAAAPSIEGTWKFDLASAQVEEQPDVFLLKDDTYSCSTCVPPLTVSADGAFHPVADRPYYDSVSVKVVDDKTVTTVRKKGDRVTSETTRVVTPDGNSMAVSISNSSTPNTAPISSKRTVKRVAAAPAGSHAISGSWKTATYDSMSDAGLTVTFRLEGNTLNMSGAGESYAAKLDGTYAPIEGDIGGTMVSVERLSANSFRETFKRDGKLLSVSTLALTNDGKLSVVNEDKVQKGTSRFIATKQ